MEISGTVFTPLSISQQIEEFFQTFLSKAEVIPDPFEQAFFVMVQLPHLPAFADVNKRVSRIGSALCITASSEEKAGKVGTGG